MHCNRSSRIYLSLLILLLSLFDYQTLEEKTLGAISRDHVPHDRLTFN